VSSEDSYSDDAAIEVRFVDFMDGNRRAYEYCWDRCQRHTPSNPLPKWERFAIWLYATTGGFWYKRVNDPLRGGNTLSETAQYVVDHLAAGLKKLPEYRGRAYRGIRVANLSEFLGEYILDNIVTWRAFSSASANADYAVSGNVQFNIESHTGKILGDYADLREEREIVFLPETKFRVQSLVQDDERAIIYLEELAPREVR
jgi:hypothetical protein